MDVEELDEATRELLMRATLHPEWVTRLRCLGTVDGEACTDQLYQCRTCRQIGCWTTACAHNLFDRGNVCQRCGAAAGLNRNVKSSAVKLAEIWHQLHAAAEHRS